MPRHAKKFVTIAPTNADDFFLWLVEYSIQIEQMVEFADGLVERGLLDWDDPIRDVLRLYNTNLADCLRRKGYEEHLLRCKLRQAQRKDEP